jgi:hypothetical protein
MNISDDVLKAMKLNIINNAISFGWIVTHVLPNKYVLTKKVSELTTLDNNCSDFLDAIFTFDEHKIFTLENNAHITVDNAKG